MDQSHWICTWTHLVIHCIAFHFTILSKTYINIKQVSFGVFLFISIIFINIFISIFWDCAGKGLRNSLKKKKPARKIYAINNCVRQQASSERWTSECIIKWCHHSILSSLCDQFLYYFNFFVIHSVVPTLVRHIFEWIKFVRAYNTEHRLSVGFHRQMSLDSSAGAEAWRNKANTMKMGKWAATVLLTRNQISLVHSAVIPLRLSLSRTHIIILFLSHCK